MSAGRRAILEKRAALVTRAARQRDELGEALQSWQGPVRVVERGLGMVQAVRRAPRIFPVLFAVAGVVTAIARPRMISRVFHGGRAVWRITRAVGRLVRAQDVV